MRLFYSKREVRMSEAIDDMEMYCQLDDTIFNRILHSSDPKLKESREIVTKIMRRQLYKFVKQTQLEKSIDQVSVLPHI